jgi:hypothetical protein
MKRFKCTVERTDEYIIEFDENVINDEWMEGFSSYMWKVTEHEELAEHIAQFRARFGERFIEGFGRPLENGKKPTWAEDDELNKAINVQVVSEDNECYVEVEEI